MIGHALLLPCLSRTSGRRCTPFCRKPVVSNHLVRQGLNRRRGRMRQAIVLHYERDHEGNDPRDIHCSRYDQRSEKQEVEERTRHGPSFVLIARVEGWQWPCRRRWRFLARKYEGNFNSCGKRSPGSADFSAGLRKTTQGLVRLKADATDGRPLWRAPA